MIVRHNLTQDRGAEFSDCERYRYSLRYSFFRSVLSPPHRPVLFLMLNPSKADELDPDPTVKRCMGYARAWGHSDLLVANLFALRSTDPNELLRVDDPIGPENNRVLQSIPLHIPIICAWGNHRAIGDRARRVVELLGDRELLCLKVNDDGSPGHPLYLSKTLQPIPWRLPE